MLPGMCAVVGGLGAAVASTVADLSTTSVTGSSSTSTINSGSVSASWHGDGSGSYTYAWAFIENNGSLSIVSAALQTTTFRKTSAASGNTYEAVAYCVVTDTGTGLVQTTGNVTISLNRT